MSSTPTLLIVMGTSGSGKSTVGSALSSALDCAFVDGDDLHPASNVNKMSKGQPLNDADREPWLIEIRRTGLKLATSQKRPTVEHGGQGVKQMAEVYETSHAATTSLDAAAANTTQDPPPQQQTGSTSHIAIIACSSLKLVYRRLLRGSITSLSDPHALQPELAEPKDLKVIHIYLDLSRQLLEERMRNRKGHFMKLDMLYSQLDTLQVPDPEAEPGVVRVKVLRETTTDEIVRDAVTQLKSRGLIDA